MLLLTPIHFRSGPRAPRPGPVLAQHGRLGERGPQAIRDALQDCQPAQQAGPPPPSYILFGSH